MSKINPRILISPDSFKGSLSALEAARAMARGVRRALPRARVEILPLADGGEGSLAALAQAGGRLVSRRVTGPLGRPVRASLLELPGRLGVIEMAQCAGLLLVPRGRRDPGRMTTRGVGELVAAAVRRGARRIAVLAGGSATNDGGMGMAQALGVRLTDRRGRPVPPGGAGLAALSKIDVSPARRLLRGVRVVGATDVRNPLLGPSGATRMFAPQKGASPAAVRMLERGMGNYARVIRRDLGRDVRTLPGAGSAGGLGAGLVAFLGGKLVSGADLVFDTIGFDRRLRRADLVLTGEGHLDRQTVLGKLVARVARRAHRRKVPVLAFAGQVALDRKGWRSLGLAGAYGLSGDGIAERYAMKHAAKLLERKVAAVMSRWADAES